MARVALLIVPLLLSFAPRTGTGSERPNFVFFLVDDLGYMDIGANNPKTFYETPHIDRLAREGMRFTNGYAASPVCSPTRYSIMTGRYPARAKVTNYFVGRRVERFRGAPFRDRMPLEEVTIAEALRKAGYRTAFLGKWHLGPTPEYWPENQGFEINIGGFSAGMPRFGYFSPYRNPRLSDGPEGEYLTERLTAEALRIIERWRNQPFFLFFSFYNVHTPLQAPADLVARYRRKAKRWAVGQKEFGTEEQNFHTDRPRRVRLVQKHPVYAAMVHAVDRAVGRIMAKLNELGLAERTVVLFTSDNGGLSTSEGHPTSNLPLRAGKGWLYEGGIREPWLIKWPGVVPGGSTCDVPVISTDFYPTILEIAGLPPRPEQHLDGLSLVPLLRGSSHFPERPLFWHYPHYGNQGGFPGGAIRLGRYKLLLRYEDGRHHLYDLKADIGERHDLAQAMPEHAKELRKQLLRWLEAMDAEFLRPRPGGPQPWLPPFRK